MMTDTDSPAMTCPDCGYLISAHHTECFRCKGLEIGRWSKEKRRDQAEITGEPKYLLTVATVLALLLYMVVRLHASSQTANSASVREIPPALSATADRRPRRGVPSDESGSGEVEAQGE